MSLFNRMLGFCGVTAMQNYTVHINQPPANLLREHYSLTENRDVEEIYYDSFLGRHSEPD